MARLRLAGTIMRQALKGTNDAILRVLANLRRAVDEYNRLLGEAEAFRGEIEKAIADHIESKDFDWQCSEEGQEFNDGLNSGGT